MRNTAILPCALAPKTASALFPAALIVITIRHIHAVVIGTIHRVVKPLCLERSLFTHRKYKGRIEPGAIKMDRL